MLTLLFIVAALLLLWSAFRWLTHWLVRLAVLLVVGLSLGVITTSDLSPPASWREATAAVAHVGSDLASRVQRIAGRVETSAPQVAPGASGPSVPAVPRGGIQAVTSSVARVIEQIRARVR